MPRPARRRARRCSGRSRASSAPSRSAALTAISPRWVAPELEDARGRRPRPRTARPARRSPLRAAARATAAPAPPTSRGRARPPGRLVSDGGRRISIGRLVGRRTRTPGSGTQRRRVSTGSARCGDQEMSAALPATIVSVVALHREEAVLRVGDDLRAGGLGDAHLTLGEDREHRLVTRHEADLALDGLGDDERRLPRPDLRVGGDEAHLERHDQPFSFWMRAHCSSTSAMPPTLKNACSATWSKSPLTIASNDSMVSLIGTVEPSTPVNFFAM